MNATTATALMSPIGTANSPSERSYIFIIFFANFKKFIFMGQFSKKKN